MGLCLSLASIHLPVMDSRRHQDCSTGTPTSFDRPAHRAWYIDNTAALMALIRGRSDIPDLERMSHLIRTLLFSVHCWMYCEWIPSESNWADATSRDGHSDPCHHAQNFSSGSAYFPEVIWNLPFSAVLRLGSFLYVGTSCMSVQVLDTDCKCSSQDVSVPMH